MQQSEIDDRVMTVVDSVIGPNKGIDKLIALTVASVFNDRETSPMFPLLEYAVTNFSSKSNYLDLPMVSSYSNEETWVSVLGKCCSLHLLEVLNYFDDESKYNILKREIKRALNGG